MAIKALIFDFDGLILDTEVPEFQSWQELYNSFGYEFTLEDWAQNIGSSPNKFDPATHLQILTQGKIHIDEIINLHHTRSDELIRDKKILPGVEEYIGRARYFGFKLGVASSSTRKWVFGNLSRLHLIPSFDCILTADEVTLTKPDPELYIRILEKLNISPSEGIALEDSPNGIQAAKAAGLICVAVPNSLTKNLDLNMADIIINSLADLSLDNLLTAINLT